MGINKLLLVPISDTNTESDENLRSAWQVESKGIGVSEIAYSNRLNAILRQLSTVTNSVADLVLNHTKISEIGSTETNRLTATKLEQGLVNLVLANAENKNITREKGTFWSGPTTEDEAKPEFRALVAGDIPYLNASKINDGTFALERFAKNLITLEKLVQIPGVSILGNKTGTGDGDIASIAAGTNGHILTRREDALTFGFVIDENIENNTIDAKKLKDLTITTKKLEDTSVTNAKLASGAVSKDKLENQAITKSKLNHADADAGERILTGAGGVLADHMLANKYRSVTSFNDSNYIIREITSSDFNNLAEKDPKTIYLVV